MSINRNAMIVPGHGTLFIADELTPIAADPLNAFNLTGDAPAGWENLGHTAKDNTAAFGRDGGDATTLDSWLADGVDTIHAAVNWSLTFNPLQLDANTLDLAFAGATDTDGGYLIPGGVVSRKKALVLLATDGTGKLIFYMPSTSVALSDAPAFSTDGYFQLPTSASIQGVDDSVLQSVNGIPAIMKLYKTGFTASKPRLTKALPAGAAQGSQVTIEGSSFSTVTGAAGVKFGSANASTYTVVDDKHIVAVVPAGSAGSAPIVVANPTGASAAFAYTRGA